MHMHLQSIYLYVCVFLTLDYYVRPQGLVVPCMRLLLVRSVAAYKKNFADQLKRLSPIIF